LIGRGSGSGGDDAGVNAMAWDPHHMFQLASAGDDCTMAVMRMSRV